MKIKAKSKKDQVNVKLLVQHEMSTYNQAKAKTGDRENANFITHISATVNGETVYDASTSQFVSKNPIFKFSFKGIGKKGDKLVVTWTDRKGVTETDSAKIK